MPWNSSLTSWTFGILALFAQQEPRELVETRDLDDGSVESWEYVLGENGEHVHHGDYLRIYSDGETVAETGRFTDGLRTGKWQAFFESGRKASEGSYRDGKKFRSWKFYFDRSRKTLRAKGRYKDGLREGEWSCLLESGEEDLDRSGSYRVFDGWCVEGLLRGRGELRLGSGGKLWERHGDWRFAWPDDTTMLEAEFEQGQPAGDWRFYHCDGTLDPEFMSSHRELSSGASKKLSASSLAAIRGLLPAPPEELAVLENLERLLKLALENQADPLQSTRPVILNHASELTGQVLRRLVDLNLENPVDSKLAESLLRVLSSLVGSRSFGEQSKPTTGTAAPTVLTIHRWFSLWWLTRDDHLFWRLSLQQPKESSEDRALFHPTLPIAPVANSGPAERITELEVALDWLARHQSPEGNWDCDEFWQNCPRPAPDRNGNEPTQSEIATARCSGSGYAEHDVGVTALALLAFLRAGHSIHSKDYGRVVGGGLAWLGRQRDSDGQIGLRETREFIYNHAIATLALAEALGSGHGTRSLHRIVERAVDMIQRARDPYGAWRYDAPSLGKSDTSVTGWMLAALVAAREAGILVDQNALDAGLMHIDAMTDQSNGRIGYSAMGSGSARIPGINDSYFVDKAEPLTAIGLLSIVLLEPQPERIPVLTKHADLIMRRLPVWELQESANDVYYWRAASEAFYHARGISKAWKKRWKKWSAAMLETASESQCQEGGRIGSWDPVGPWGMIGGRVYSTAMMALALIATDDE